MRMFKRTFKNLHLQKNDKPKTSGNGGTSTNSGNGGTAKNKGTASAPKNLGSGGSNRNSSNGGEVQNTGSSSQCQGGSLEKCIESCPTQGYANCVSACGKKC